MPKNVNKSNPKNERRGLMCIHAEVTSARIRLDATLQHLVDKKDDGNLSSDGEGLSHLDLLQSDPSPLPSPSKKAGSRQSRKRKRKDDSDLLDGGQYHHTYVMKLFDRSVDLAQFDEEAALYPICRAWLKNQPSNRRLWPRERTPDPEPPVTDHDDEEVDQLQDVYKMPPPIKDDPDCLMQDFRIPAPIPQPTERLDINANQNQALPPEQLLLEHMHRWKETRTSWREAGFLNEMKFAASMNLLREIFESQMKEEVP